MRGLTSRRLCHRRDFIETHSRHQGGIRSLQSKPCPLLLKFTVTDPEINKVKFQAVAMHGLGSPFREVKHHATVSLVRIRNIVTVLMIPDHMSCVINLAFFLVGHVLTHHTESSAVKSSDHV